MRGRLISRTKLRGSLSSSTVSSMCQPWSANPKFPSYFNIPIPAPVVQNRPASCSRLFILAILSGLLSTRCRTIGRTSGTYKSSPNMPAGTASFDEMARQHSKCGSAKKGGELGWLSRGTFFPQFEAAAFAAPLGGLARAITGRGLHLIKVLGER
ncbi:hypothetical protein Vafri_10605, partial [Volvox africanus]